MYRYNMIAKKRTKVALESIGSTGNIVGIRKINESQWSQQTLSSIELL
jgi:hypothetical protein